MSCNILAWFGSQQAIQSERLPLYQKESSCEAIHMKIPPSPPPLQVHFHANQTHFCMKPVFKQRFKVARI